MKRYPAFDPPEYVAWTRDDREVEAFRQRVRADPARAAIVDRLTREQHFELYRGLVRTRLTDIALKRWVRQGVISKAWLGTGEEAVTVGPVHALRRMRNAESGSTASTAHGNALHSQSAFRIPHSSHFSSPAKNCSCNTADRTN